MFDSKNHSADWIVRFVIVRSCDSGCCTSLQPCTHRSINGSKDLLNLPYLLLVLQKYRSVEIWNLHTRATNRAIKPTRLQCDCRTCMTLCCSSARMECKTYQSHLIQKKIKKMLKIVDIAITAPLLWLHFRYSVAAPHHARCIAAQLRCSLSEAPRCSSLGWPSASYLASVE